MKLTNEQVKELRRWAREQAPVAGIVSRHGSDTDDEAWYRPVKLEIAVENYVIQASDLKPFKIVVRAYLRDPRCRHEGVNNQYYHEFRMTPCECGPLAERRLA